MEPSLTDLIAQLSEVDAQDAIAGLEIPEGYTLSRLIFEIIEAYYAAQKKLNAEKGIFLEFVSEPSNSKIRENSDGSYELTCKYSISGIISLGFRGFRPLDSTPEIKPE